jgi:hypothetical protein
VRCICAQVFWSQFAVVRRNVPSVAVIAPKVAPTPAPKNSVGLCKRSGEHCELTVWCRHLLHFNQSSSTSLIASSTLCISCGASCASGPWTSRRLSIARS